MSFYLNATLPPEDSGICFLRRTIKWNTPGLVAPVAGIGAAIPIGALPAGAIPIGCDVSIQEAFNGGGNTLLDIGVTGTVEGFMTDTVAAAGTPGFKTSIAGALNGIPVLVDTVVYATYTWSVGAATTGIAHVILKFVPKRDGVGQGNPAV